MTSLYLYGNPPTNAGNGGYFGPTQCICTGQPIPIYGIVTQFLVYGGNFASQWGVSYCIYRPVGGNNYTIIGSTSIINLPSPLGPQTVTCSIPVQPGDCFGFCNANGYVDFYFTSNSSTLWQITSNSGSSYAAGTTFNAGTTNNIFTFGMQVGISPYLPQNYYQTPILSTDPILDRNVEMVVNGKIVNLWQHTPTSLYIPLVVTGTAENFSSNIIPTRGGWTPNDSNVYTYFTKIRFDPISMLLCNNDYTYSTSSGYCGHYASIGVTSAFPLGTCYDCQAPGSQTGQSNINLVGTPFAINDTFTYGGYDAAGSWTFSNNNQTVNLTGGGYCGYCGPTKCASENATVLGGWVIQLKLI